MNHYTYRKYTDCIYTITERYTPDDGGSTMGLIIGTEKAAIIDTGMGVTGNLREYIGTITDKPVICILTHPHPDHAGSAVLFDECYMNPADASMLSWALSKAKRRGQMSKFFALVPGFEAELDAEILDSEKMRYKPMSDGDVFDLGGRTLKVISVPGHTAGSVCLLCPEENVIFCGDSVAAMTSLIGEGPEDYVKLTDFRAGLKKLQACLNENTTLFCYHRELPTDIQVVGDMIQACEKVLSGRASREETVLFPFLMEKERGREYYQEVVGLAKLVYDTASLEA